MQHKQRYFRQVNFLTIKNCVALVKLVLTRLIVATDCSSFICPRIFARFSNYFFGFFNVVLLNVISVNREIFQPKYFQLPIPIFVQSTHFAAWISLSLLSPKFAFDLFFFFSWPLTALLWKLVNLEKENLKHWNADKFQDKFLEFVLTFWKIKINWFPLNKKRKKKISSSSQFKLVTQSCCEGLHFVLLFHSLPFTLALKNCLLASTIKMSFFFLNHD